MFNLINLYKSLICFLKADLWGGDIPGHNYETQAKSQEQQKTNEMKNHVIEKEVWIWDTPSTVLNKVWLGVLSNYPEIPADIDLFLKQNWLSFQPKDKITLKVENWAYILTVNRDNNPNVLFGFNLTQAITDRHLTDKLNINNYTKSCLKDLKWECIANGWMWEHSSLQTNKAPYNWEQNIDDMRGAKLDISKLSWAVRSHIINPENVRIAFNFFIDKWFTKEQTAWLLANMCQESSFDANPKSNKAHFWMFQWSKVRASEISSWAWVNILSRNAPIQDQLKWLYWEITENSWHWNCPWTIEAVKAANTPEEAAIAFLEKFERPWWLRKERPLRASFAKSFYQAMS